MNFVKMQATGNDFVVIDARGMKRDWSRLAVAMCNRHFGVGGDGLLLLLSSEIADFRMRMFNPDGSEAEACGNGLRCLGKYLVKAELSGHHEMKIETLAGVRTITVKAEGGIAVGMGVPRLTPSDIPVSAEAPASRGELDITPVFDYHITVEGKELSINCVSMGNPHAVSFLEEPVADFPLAELGPRVEHHRIFPQRANFEVVNIINRKQARARVWERGTGETLSCGSGACAIAVAAQLHGYTESPLDIELPGGTLAIDWGGVGEVWLTGPAEFVFQGEWLE